MKETLKGKQYDNKKEVKSAVRNLLRKQTRDLS